MFYKNKEELREIARYSYGIKNPRKFAKRDLAIELGYNPELVCPVNKMKNLKIPPRKICIFYHDTNETVYVRSIHQCSKILKKNPGSIHYCLKHGRSLKTEDGLVKLCYA